MQARGFVCPLATRRQPIVPIGGELIMGREHEDQETRTMQGIRPSLVGEFPSGRLIIHTPCVIRVNTEPRGVAVLRPPHKNQPKAPGSPWQKLCLSTRHGVCIRVEIFDSGRPLRCAHLEGDEAEYKSSKPKRTGEAFLALSDSERP